MKDLSEYAAFVGCKILPPTWKWWCFQEQVVKWTCDQVIKCSND
jgi:hypothetical protein